MGGIKAYKKYTPQEWTDWIASLPDKGWGKRAKQGWIEFCEGWAEVIKNGEEANYKNWCTPPKPTRERSPSRERSRSPSCTLLRLAWAMGVADLRPEPPCGVQCSRRPAVRSVRPHSAG